LKIDNSKLHFDKAQIAVGNTNISGKTLIVNVDLADSLHQSLNFNCTMKLNSSSFLNFIPIGQNTNVSVVGQWQSPSFIGNFSPESNIDNKQFTANWNILSFNREIPETWSDNNVSE
jgi:inner membrane protein